MKLVANKNHKKIDFNSLKKTSAIAISGILSLSLYSGAFPKKVKAEDNIEQNIYINDTYGENSMFDIYEQTDSLNKLGSIYSSDLYDNNKKRFIDLNRLNGTTLKHISLENINLNDIENINQLNNLPYLNSIYLGCKDSVDFCENNFSFLFNFPNLKEIQIEKDEYTSSIDYRFLEQFTNLESIELIHCDYDLDLDFSKFPKLKYLWIKDAEAYSLAIGLDSEQLNYLESHNVIINGVNVQKLREIDATIDNIVSKLNVDVNSSDQDKLDAILVYILENYEYSNDSENNITSKFYNNGYLYGALERNGDIICGNYAALLQALANRLDLETQFIFSDDHAWNLVNIEDEYYYVDPTWLDNEFTIGIDFPNIIFEPSNLIKNKQYESLDNYLFEVENTPSHSATNFPTYITISPVDNIESKDKSYKVIFGKYKKVIATGIVSFALIKAIIRLLTRKRKKAEDLINERKNRH